VFLLLRSSLSTFRLPACVCSLALLADPLSDAAVKVQGILTGPLATAAGVIAIAYAGYVLMFGDGSSKRIVVGVCIGIALVIGAARLLPLIRP